MVSITNIKNPGSNKGQRSKTHRLFQNNSGFTLLELIVVISLFGLMLFFSLPRLQDNPFLDDRKESARWLIGKVQLLKENAIRNQKQYTLHFDLDGSRVWETNETMSQDDIESAALNSKGLPGDLRIVDVEYPTKGKIEYGIAEITFYKAGYTDKAIVHLQDGDTNLSFNTWVRRPAERGKSALTIPCRLRSITFDSTPPAPQDMSIPLKRQ